MLKIAENISDSFMEHRAKNIFRRIYFEDGTQSFVIFIYLYKNGLVLRHYSRTVFVKTF